jgi:anti-anti-sigma factor
MNAQGVLITQPFAKQPVAKGPFARQAGIVRGLAGVAQQKAYLEIRQIGDLCLLRFSGRLRTGEDPGYLNEKLHQIRRLDCTKALVDFRGVSSIGSEGLSFLLEIFYEFQGRVIVVGAQPRVKEVLDITRLSSVLPMAEDTESGLTRLKN